MTSADPLALWRQARHFSDLCALGARFAEGEPVGFPGWLPGELDEESMTLGPLLAKAQRAGFLTLASQPGADPISGADGRLERRREFVFGFAEAELAGRLEAACQAQDLWGVSYAATSSGGEAWPVAERGQEAFLMVGDAQGPAELELFEDALGPGPALKALARTRYLVLTDPEWGRKDGLWSCLDSALS